MNDYKNRKPTEPDANALGGVRTEVLSGEFHFNSNRFKVAVCGEHGCGKSAFIRRIVRNEFNDLATEMDPTQVLQRRFYERMTKVEITEVDAESLIIDDSRSKEDTERLRKVSDWVDVNIVLLLFDTTSEGSFDRLLTYFKILTKTVAPNCEICFVGTKCDKMDARKVSYAQADGFAEKAGLSLFEISAVTKVNVDDCLDEVVCRAYERRLPQVETYVSEVVYPTDNLVQTQASAFSADDEDEKAGGGVMPNLFCFINWWRK